MSRKEFLGQLERLLWDIPEQERKEALEYYRSYFEDAGEENEASVIQELGSPGKVAAIIKADLEENREEYGEYTETGYTDERFNERDMPQTRDAAKEFREKRTGYGQNNCPVKKGRSGASWVLIIILIILGAPIWGSILVGLLGAVIGIIAGAFGIVVGVLFGGIGLIIGGVAALIKTLIFHISTPATAIALAGAAMVLIAVGLLLIAAFIWLAFKAFPVCFRWSVDFIQKILHRGRMGGDIR